MCYQFIKDITLYIARRKEKKVEQRKAALKERLLRYFEDGQRNAHGSFFQTKAMLLQSNLFESTECDIIPELLEDLVHKGFLEYQGGSYYLVGHAPKL